MLIARLYDFGDIRLEQADKPRPGPDDIVVRTRACGICTGDIMPWYLRRKAPLVFGHEPVGVVEEVGAMVKDFKSGDRVFAHHHAPCFSCPACRRGEYVQCPAWRASRLDPGGMAECFVVAAANQRDTLKLEPGMTDAEGVLIEPAACVVKSLRKSGLKPGESILVIGLGIMGMMHVILARHMGAGTIIGADFFEQRAYRAIRLGADFGLVAGRTDLAEKVRETTSGAMVDVVIVGPGTPEALTTGIACAGPGATVVQFTSTPPGQELAVKPHDLYFNEIKLVPSYSCGPNDTREAFSLIQQGVLKGADLVTHTFAVEQIAEAFVAAQKPEALKVVVTFP